MIVISYDVIFFLGGEGIAQPLYVHASYAMYSFMCICEYCRAEGRMIFMRGSSLASSNNRLYRDP